MIKEIESDIFLADTDAIIHQVNCFHTMNSGIARFIRENFPEAYKADCGTIKGYEYKLGSFSYVKITTPNPNPRLKYIFNMYSQFRYGRDEKHTNYEAMDKGLKAIKKFTTATYDGKEIKTLAIPYRIGSNLGGGDWNVVKAIIYSVFENSELKVLICKNPALQAGLLNRVSK